VAIGLNIDVSSLGTWSVFGNYCGPNYSAGKFWQPGEVPDFRVEAEGAVDRQCKIHDIRVTDAEQLKLTDPLAAAKMVLDADIQLIKNIDQMLFEFTTGKTQLTPSDIAIAPMIQNAFTIKVIIDVIQAGREFNSQQYKLLFGKDMDWKTLQLVSRQKALFDPWGKFPRTPKRPLYDPAPPTRRDPLALDLNSDGLISTTSAQSYALHFDHDANTFAEATGWIAPQDGLLAWDRNGNGTIDTGVELFGDQTILRSGAKATSGLQALAEWDTDKNNRIDSADAHFADLRVWTDANQDGISQSDELQTLTGAGIASISLAGFAPNPADPNTTTNAALGNTIARTSTFTRTDGSTGLSAEINLRRDTALSIPVASYTVPDTVAALPDLSGYGNLLDLHQALAKESAAGGAAPLAAALNQYLAEVGAGDTPTRNVALDTLLFTWANAAGVAPLSRGAAMDARQITFLETLFAQSLGNPDSNAAIQWRMSWQDIREYYGASLLAQTTLKPLFDAIQYAWDDASQTLKADLASVTTLLQDKLAADPVQGTAQLADFARAIKGLGAEDSVNYLALRETFFEHNPELAWAMDSAGMKVYDHRGQGSRGLTPHIEGTDTADAVRGSLTEGDTYINGLYGSDTIWGSSRYYETLINEDGDSLLYGGAGSDNLLAGAGDDTLDGGTDNDTLQGEAGNDTYIMRRGSGVDRIRGWNAGDRVWLAANAIDATLKRNRNDLIVGFTDTPDKLVIDNYYLITAPQTTVITFRDGATLDAAGIDAWLATPALAGQGTDVIDGSASAETLMGYGGDDRIAGNGGSDTIEGGAGSDRLLGAATYDPYSDSLAPVARANGDDTYVFRRGDGNDTIIDLDPAQNSDTLRLVGIDPAEVGVVIDNARWDWTSQSSVADIVLDLGLGESVALSQALSSNGPGLGKIERIEFDDGTVWTEADLRGMLLAGTDGDDIIRGWGDADVIDGGAGMDSLYGNAGDDAILGGDGNDWIQDSSGDNALSGGAGSDRVYAGAGDDTVAGGEDADVIYGEAGADTLLGDAGADILFGGAGSDSLDGGAGDDLLGGGSPANQWGGYEAGNFGIWLAVQPGDANGDDTYRFGRGAGRDIVVDRDRTAGNTDTIEIAADITPDQVRLTRFGSDLVVTLTDAPDTLTVKNWFLDSGAEWRVEQIRFMADGSMWDVAGIRAAVLLGTDAAETIRAYEGSDDTIRGLGGSDTLLGLGGDDLLDGGDGNDQLIGGEGADLLDGGAGADTLYGGALAPNAYQPDGPGNDTYRFGFGDGIDTVIERDGGLDRVEFKAGVTPNDVAVRRVGNDLVLSLSATDRLTLKDWVLGDAYAVEAARFGDGTVWDAGELMRRAVLGGAGADWLTGFDGGDTVVGGAGNDVLIGGRGDDSYVFHAGDGADLVIDSQGRDAIRFADLMPDAMLARRAGDDLILNAGGDRVTVSDWFRSDTVGGVQSVTFADGTAWDAARLLAEALRGTPEADVLTGYNGADVIDGLAGADTLQGSRGDDTYVFRRGDGNDVVVENDATAGNVDTLHLLDLLSTDVTLKASDFDLLVEVADGGGSVRIRDWFANDRAKVERIVFADGDTWDAARIQAEANTASNNDDSLVGTPGPDSLDGQGGNDTLLGLAGDDALLGGSGADWLEGGDGNDVLTGGTGNDTLRGGHGSNAYRFEVGDGFDDIVTGAARRYSYPNQVWEAQWNLEQLSTLADTDTFQDEWWYWSNIGSAPIWNELPQNLADGLLAIANGVSAAEARITLSELNAWFEQKASDTLVLGEGITPDMLSVQYRPGAFADGGEGQVNPPALAIGFGNAEGVLMQLDLPYLDYSNGGHSGLWPDVGLQKVRFADGSELSLQQLIAMADSDVVGEFRNDDGRAFVLGSVAADDIGTGNNYWQDQHVDARGGNDRVRGDEGNDVIFGGDGNDIIASGWGDDILAGGKGDDYLAGYQDTNIYAFNRGDGHDTIYNTGEASWARPDILSLGGGIRPEDVGGYIDAAGGLVIEIAGGDDTVTLSNWFRASGGGWVQSDGMVNSIQFIDAAGGIRRFALADMVSYWTGQLAAANEGNPFALFATGGIETTVDGEAKLGNAIAYAQLGDLFAEPVNFQGDAADDVVTGSPLGDFIDVGGGNNVVNGGDGNDDIHLGDGDNLAVGGAGDDNYHVGAGRQTIVDAAGVNNENRLKLYDVWREDVTLRAEDGFLILEIDDGDGSEVRLAGFDSADPYGPHPVSWFDFIDTATGNQETYSYEDMLDNGIFMVGSADADVMVGTVGNDVLAGGEGNDIYVYNQYSGRDRIVDSASEFAGNEVRFGDGISPADLWLSIDADPDTDGATDILTVHVGDGEDALRFANVLRNDLGGNHPVETFRFADGSEMSWQELLDLGFTFEGYEDYNGLYGTDQVDTFLARGVYSELVGGGGDDTYWHQLGDGETSIVDDAVAGAGNTLLFGDGISQGDVQLELQLGGFDVNVANDSGIHLVTTANWNEELERSPSDRVVENFAFADGSNIDFETLASRGVLIDRSGYGDEGQDITGTQWQDIVFGSEGSDTIAGGTGGDTIAGGMGDDTYVYNRGDGKVTIDDTATLEEGNTLRFGAGITLDDMVRSLRFKAPDADQPGEFIIKLGETGDEIHIAGFDPLDPELGAHGVDNFAFADGTVLSYREMVRNTFIVQGDAGDDDLSGTTVGDRLYGYEGNDTLVANAGSDALTGGTGDDVMIGGAGNDVYILDLGSGNDTVIDSTLAAADNLLVFGDGITRDSLSFDYEADGLRVRYSATDSVFLQGYDATSGERVVNAFEFADGGQVTLAELLDLAPELLAALGDGTAVEDSAFEWTVPAAAFADLDFDDALSFTVTGANGEPLPEWMSFNPATMTLSGTPENADVGSFVAVVTATDRYGKTASASATIEVLNTNDTPVVTGEQFVIDEDVPLVLTSADLTANDFDIDPTHDLLAVAAVGNASHGAVSLAADGSVRFVADADYNGSASFDYVVADGQGGFADATVQMQINPVNDAPVASADSDATAEDSTLPILGNVLANDTDVDGGAILSVANPGDRVGMYGTLLLAADGSYSYQLDNASADVQALAADQVAVDHFAYEVTDGMLAGAGSLDISVTGANDAPVVVADMAATVEDAALPATGNVLANDTDVDNGTVLQVAASGNYLGAYGTLMLAADGSYSYALDNASAAVQSLAQGQSLSDSFNFAATDGFVAVASTLEVSVAGANDAPVAGADTALTVEDAVEPVVGNVLDNDSDIDAGTLLQVAAPGNYLGALGTLSIEADGSYSYALDSGSLDVQALAQGQVVTEHFAFAITDGLAPVESSLDITVTGANDAPFANPDSAALDASASGPLLGNVLTNDTDIDAGTVLQVAAPGTYLGSYGTLTLANDGSYSYALNGNSAGLQALGCGGIGVDRFTYEATDGIVTVGSALDITVAGTSGAPIAAPDSAIVVEDLLNVARGNVLANDLSGCGENALTVKAPGSYAGTYGTLALAADGSYQYALDNRASAVQSLGRDALAIEHFGYEATNGQSDAASTLDVFLHGSNDAPIVAKPLADGEIKRNKAFAWQLPAGSFKDVDVGDTLTYKATLADGKALPSWLRFDAQSLTFYGVAPKKEAELSIRVTATDRLAATGSTVGSLSVSDVFKLKVGESKHEDKDRDKDNSDGEHDRAQSSGACGSANQSDFNGNHDDRSGNDDHDGKDTKRDTGWQRESWTIPAYLGEWNPQYLDATGTHTTIDSTAVFARWLELDIAIAKFLAEQGALPWADDGNGADPLNQATTGFLGSTVVYGHDVLSLPGLDLKAFSGLQEGLQKVA